MNALLWFVAAWNVAAILFGLAGAARPAWRPLLARVVRQQATAALAASIVAILLGVFATLIGLSLGAAAPPAGSLLAALFWALGGLLPFTVGVFLRARRRDSPQLDVD